MKKLRFRLWNKKKKTIMLPRDPNVEGELVICLNGKIYHSYAIEMGYGDGTGADLFKVEQENYIIMQFTGLKDKNGKEIYEGDIVDSGDGIFWIIEWFNYGWWIYNKTEGNHILDYYGDEYIIVGNIYENSNLIKSTSKEGNTIDEKEVKE